MHPRNTHRFFFLYFRKHQSIGFQIPLSDGIYSPSPSVQVLPAPFLLPVHTESSCPHLLSSVHRHHTYAILPHPALFFAVPHIYTLPAGLHEQLQSDSHRQIPEWNFPLTASPWRMGNFLPVHRIFPVLHSPGTLPQVCFYMLPVYGIRHETQPFLLPGSDSA